MNQWLEQVKKNLLPFSINQNDVKQALSEWIYEGNIIDLGKSFETCELCGHEGIRYQFEIENPKTNRSLLIGSECVTKFGGVNVLDENGNALSIGEARKKVNKDKNKVIANAKTRSVINSLIELVKADNEITFMKELEESYRERGAFSPRQIFLVLWRLEKNKIPFNKSYFKVSLRKKAEKQSLLDMEDWKVKKIWSALSDSQRKLFINKNK